MRKHEVSCVIVGETKADDLSRTINFYKISKLKKILNECKLTKAQKIALVDETIESLLAKYANPEFISLEDGAWERAVRDE